MQRGTQAADDDAPSTPKAEAPPNTHDATPKYPPGLPIPPKLAVPPTATSKPRSTVVPTLSAGAPEFRPTFTRAQAQPPSTAPADIEAKSAAENDVDLNAYIMQTASRFQSGRETPVCSSAASWGSATQTGEGEDEARSDEEDAATQWLEQASPQAGQTICIGPTVTDGEESASESARALDYRNQCLDQSQDQDALVGMLVDKLSIRTIMPASPERGGYTRVALPAALELPNADRASFTRALARARCLSSFVGVPYPADIHPPNTINQANLPFCPQ